jgi:hypothetical protein
MNSIMTRIVRRQGINFENKIYYHPALIPYQESQIIVHMGTEGLRVFDVNGNPICTAEEVIFSSATPARGKNLASV